jgi:hypothetical protein
MEVLKYRVYTVYSVHLTHGKKNPLKCTVKLAVQSVIFSPWSITRGQAMFANITTSEQQGEEERFYAKIRYGQKPKFLKLRCSAL